MSAPAITVLMPVYNAERYLREAIDSVLGQTFKDFEFFIINDGSTDNSERIILSYNDPRIRYVKNEQNLKLIATLNKSIGMIGTKYMVRTDADDVNMLNRLELQYRFMEEHPEVGLLGAGFETFGSNQPTHTVRYSPDHNTICLKHLYQIHLSHGTAIFRMNVLKDRNLLFDPDYAHAEDYELWTRISKFSKLANLQDVLYRVRHHENEVSRLHSSTQTENSLRIKRRQFAEMGVQVSDEDIALYTHIAQYQYNNSKAFVTKAQQLLEKLVAANDKSALIDKEFFRKQMGALWFNITYNSRLGWWACKQFQSCILSMYRPLSAIERIKFLIKGVV